jgi:mycofactocin system glycosyltransferase
MRDLSPIAPSAVEAPVAEGTTVFLDPGATFYDRQFIAGGSPWRLLRLSDSSRQVAERWQGGGVVQAGEERFARTLVQQGLLHPLHESTISVNDVDVVIPVRDDVALLRSVLEQFVGFHVTVVDDASLNPMTLNECVAHFGVDLVRLEENLGPGGARNAGAHATERPLVWFVDVDVVVDSAAGVLDRLARQFNDPLVGAVAPRVRGGVGESLRDRFEREFGPLDMGPLSGLALPGATVAYVPSACLLVRRSALGDGFDPSLRHGEDVDLVWRLHDHGWLVRYVAEVVVTHRARGNWRQWWSQRVTYGESSSELALRHGARLAPLRSDAWTLVAWASALAGKPAIGGRIVRIARNHLRDRLAPSSDDPGQVARAVVGRGMSRSGGPLARSVVRTYGPLVLIATLHPKLRRRALVLFVIGTAWRWRRSRVRVADVPLAIADDLAYGVGVWRGAWRSRSLRALTPQITKSSIGLREILGLKDKSDESIGPAN